MKNLLFLLATIVPGIAAASNNQDCDFNPMRDTVGVYEGGIAHTFPPETFVAHSRVTLHGDGTVTEQHEVYQTVPPPFNTQVFLSTSQGYWKHTGHDTIIVQFNVDTSFAPPSPLAGDFFLKSTVTWTPTFNYTTCSWSGPWTGTVFTDYTAASQVLNPDGSPFVSTGNITMNPLPKL